MATGLWYTNVLNFGPLYWFWRCKEHPYPLSSELGLWRRLEVTDWCLASWSWLEYGHWYLIHPWSKLWLSILILKVQRNFMSFKSWFRALEDAGGSWPGFGILILIWIWFLVFDRPIFWILTLSWFWGCKEHLCPLNLDLGLFMMLEAPDWSYACLSLFRYGH